MLFGNGMGGYLEGAELHFFSEAVGSILGMTMKQAKLFWGICFGFEVYGTNYLFSHNSDR